MNLKQLYDELKNRNLGTLALRSEVGKIYGVTRLPQQQADAREEAIKILEAADKRKFTLSKGWKIAVAIIGVLGSVAGIIALF